MTFFSVVMPTRNRPALFLEAVRSVLGQTCSSLEIIVVADGVSDENRPAYEAIGAELGDKVRIHWLDQWQRGHGQSYAINFGASLAQGKYLCFLDDDDVWTDSGYLERVRNTIEASAEAVDLHFSNQEAFLLNERKAGPIWVEDLSEILPRRGRQASADGTYRVEIGDLLASHGFCHLNTLIVRREIFAEIKGMDQDIWWECDRDLYLRLIDRARGMVYAPQTVSRHNIPDPSKSLNMTTAISVLTKRLYQLKVLDKAILFAAHPAIRAHGRQHRAYALKRIAENLAGDRRYRDALYYASQAMAGGPSLKWGVYTAWLSMKALVSG